MKTRCYLALVWALGYLQNGICSASDGTGTLRSRSAFDEYVKQLLDELHVPGLSVAIIDLTQPESNQISAKGYGFARLPSIAATADTLYYTGSTTKAFTAAAAAKVIHNHTTLDWNTRIHDLLPHFQLADEYATKHTTIEDALSHRSGLAAHPLSYRPGTSIALTSSLRWVPLTGEPRERWQYCNQMYGVVADLLMTITQLDLGSLLKHYFWYPLGMKSTFFSLSDALRTAKGESSMSRGYWWVDCFDDTFGPDPSCGPGDKGYYVPESYTNLTGISGAGAVISSVNDYALWIRGILQAGLYKDWLNSSSPLVDVIDSVVRPRSIIPIDFLAPIPELLINPPKYALGWFTSRFHGRIMLSHAGAVPGHVTNVLILPEVGLGIVTLENAAGNGVIAGQLISLAILQDKLNVTQAEIEGDNLNVRETGSFFGLEALNAGSLQPRGRQKLRESSKRAPIRWRPQTRSVQFDPSLSYSSFPRSQYYHPAYGTFTLTEHVLSSSTSRGCRCDTPKSQAPLKAQPESSLPNNCEELERFLIVEPSPHILSYAIYLQPKPKDADGGTSFDGMIISLHGDCASHFDGRPPMRTFDGDIIVPPEEQRCAGSGVWETDIAYLEPFLEHYSQRIGFALEPEMARQALEKARGKRAKLEHIQRTYGADTVAGEIRALDIEIMKEGMIWFDRVEERTYGRRPLYDLTMETETWHNRYARSDWI